MKVYSVISEGTLSPSGSTTSDEMADVTSRSSTSGYQSMSFDSSTGQLSRGEKLRKRLSQLEESAIKLKTNIIIKEVDLSILRKNRQAEISEQTEKLEEMLTSDEIGRFLETPTDNCERKSAMATYFEAKYSQMKAIWEDSDNQQDVIEQPEWSDDWQNTEVQIYSLMHGENSNILSHTMQYTRCGKRDSRKMLTPRSRAQTNFSYRDMRNARIEKERSSFPCSQFDKY